MGKRTSRWHEPDGAQKGTTPEDELQAGTNIPGPEERVGLAARKLERWLESLERLRLADYVRYVDDRKRMLWSSFWGGVARGVGMAVGFSILGAVLVWILQSLARRNLPWLWELFAGLAGMGEKGLQ